MTLCPPPFLCTHSFCLSSGGAACNYLLLGVPFYYCLFDLPPDMATACMELAHLVGGFFTGVGVDIESYFSIMIKLGVKNIIIITRF